MSDKRELIKKLQALAERGIGGEKEGAQKKLDELIKKYNIDIEEVLGNEEEEDKIDYYDLYFKGSYERQILIQVIAMVGQSEISAYRGQTWTGRRSRNNIYVKCTKAQYIEIQITFEFYRDLWYEELELFSMAFINKHHLFGKCVESKEDSYESQYTKEQLLRMSFMAEGMQSKSMHKLLPSIGIEGE